MLNADYALVGNVDPGSRWDIAAVGSVVGGRGSGGGGLRGHCGLVGVSDGVCRPQLLYRYRNCHQWSEGRVTTRSTWRLLWSFYLEGFVGIVLVLMRRKLAGVAVAWATSK